MRPQRPHVYLRLSAEELATQASTVPPLDTRERGRLLGLAQGGDDEARDALVLHHLRVVVDEAIASRGLGVRQNDLIRTGLRALVGAVEVYDPEADVDFGVYVRRAVRGALRGEVRHH